MNKDLNYYMSLHYRTEVIPGEDTDGFVLHCPELPGCITCADTVEEGFKLLEDAKQCWFTACLEDGVPIPEPAAWRTSAASSSSACPSPCTGRFLSALPRRASA